MVLSRKLEKKIEIFFFIFCPENWRKKLKFFFHFFLSRKVEKKIEKKKLEKKLFFFSIFIHGRSLCCTYLNILVFVDAVSSCSIAAFTFNKDTYSRSYDIRVCLLL